MYLFFAAAVFGNEFGFYWAHRISHHSLLYGFVHKQHHIFKGTVSIAAEFAGPLEQVTANMLPTIGGCLFLGSHNLILLVWIATRLYETYEGHSGFCFYNTWLHKLGFTCADTCAYHDFHHTGNRGNFGGPMMDWLFGTMDAWVELGGAEGYIDKVGFSDEDDGWIYA